MRDWVVAIVLGVTVVSVFFAGSILMTLLSMLLTPLLILFVVILVIWILLQDAKDDDNREDGKGSDP